MADKKISQLTSGAPAQAGDEYIVARSGANYKLTLTNIAASMPPIGATTPNTGAFTDLTASGTVSFSGATVSNGGSVTTVDINGGTIDGVNIGGASPSVGTFTTLSDSLGNVRTIPQSGSAKTGSYTLAVTDVGQFIEVGSGGSITVPDATFQAGDVVSIFNNTTGTVTLTMSITTAYIGGADVDEATIDLATRGVATILFISGTVCVVNGNVS